MGCCLWNINDDFGVGVGDRRYCQQNKWIVLTRTVEGGVMRHIRELWQDVVVVAEVDAETEEEAEREIKHYALMYSKDGDVLIKKRTIR